MWFERKEIGGLISFGRGGDLVAHGAVVAAKVGGPAVASRRDKTVGERESGWWGFALVRVNGRASARLLGSEDCFPWPCPLCVYSAHRPGLGDAAKQEGVLREAGHKVARGRARAWARTRPDIVGVVSCRGLEGPGGLGERGVWFIAHQCAPFRCGEASALGSHRHIIGSDCPDCAESGRVPEYLGTCAGNAWALGYHTSLLE